MVAFILVFILMAFPAQAHSMRFGVQDDPVLVHGWWGDPDVALQRAQQLHAGTVRHIVRWQTVEVAPGVYDWSELDAALARERGMRVILTLGGTPIAPPAWQGTLSHPKLEGYLAWVRAAASRYGRLVSEWTLYNEPDWAAVPPKYYRSMFVVGRRVIQRVSPRARVYFGDLSGASPIRYTQKVLRYGRVRAEGFAWHPYQWTRPPEHSGGRPGSVGIGRIARLHNFLRSKKIRTQAGGRLPMYGTEFAYLTKGANAAPQAHAWWPRAKRVARKAGLRLLVAYQLYPDPRYNVWESPILHSDGSTTRTFRALQ